MSQDVQSNTSYEPFSLEPVYIEANRAFVEGQSLDGVQRILDLACGTGTTAEILLGRMPNAHLNGLDFDPAQIDIVTRKFREQGYSVRSGFELTQALENDKPVLVFGVGSANDLSFPDGRFDAVIMSHAIHLIREPQSFLKTVQRVLATSGVFGFNTAFYAGSMPEGTQRVYLDWIQMASDYIDRRNMESESKGSPPVRRKRGSRPVGATSRWYTIKEWKTMLEATGLRVHQVYERRVELDEHCLALVGAYGGMAEVLLSGFPVDIASEALHASAKPAMKASNVTTVPRNYLEIWATKI